jgi:hypothetical protein
MQFGIGVLLLLAGFRGQVDQGGLLGAGGEMAVHRVMAEVGFAADEPLAEGWIAVIEDLVRGAMPVDQLGLLAPECLGRVDGTAMERFVLHGSSPPDLSGMSSRRIVRCGVDFVIDGHQVS